MPCQATGSRVLSATESVDDAKLTRGMVEAAFEMARSANLSQELLNTISCDRLRAERRLGEILSRIELVKASPGNQYTGKLDRRHDDGGPTTLEELGVDESRSRRSKLLLRIPEAEFESWMAKLCEKGQAPTLKRARAYANRLFPPKPSSLSGKPSKSNKGKKKNGKQPRKKSSPDINPLVPPESPLATVLEGLEHLKIVGEQLEPLYNMLNPPLEVYVLKIIRKKIQEVADSLTELESYHRKQAYPYSPNDPYGGGANDFLERFRQSGTELKREDCQFQPTP